MYNLPLIHNSLRDVLVISEVNEGISLLLFVALVDLLIIPLVYGRGVSLFLQTQDLL